MTRDLEFGRWTVVVKPVSKLTRLLVASFLACLSTGGGVVLLGNAIVWIGATGAVVEDLAQVKKAEVAIILGAGPGSPTLDARLDAALELWESNRVVRLLVTGGSDGTGYGETEYMWRYLRRHGVPADVITVDPFGMRTLDSVQRARRVFGFDTCVVVTQRYHCYRGVFLARCSGLKAEGYAALPVDSPEFRFSERREWFARPVAVSDVLSGREAQFGDEAPTLANHPAR